jgi:Cd2+/Zn2+-exporting ATPase
MIGRFANLGSYRELLTGEDALRCAGAGLLVLASALVERWSAGPAWTHQALALASVALSGGPIVWGALRGLIGRRVNVDELVALAIVASLAQGEFLGAALVAFIMALGALAEETISDSARRGIQALAELTPEEAERMRPEGLERITVSALRVGDRVLVRPGARVPVDGVVLAGVSAMDEASVTGESVPVERGPGDTVFAGTLSQNGALEVEAVRVGEDTTFGRVARLVEEAEAHKPRATRFIDRNARWFTPLVLACAGAAWAWSGDLSRAVAVLVAGCPCALLLAAPTATVAAVARAARQGVLVKGGAQMEALASADAALFDKTGTLTMGHPRVEEVVPAQGFSQGDVLRLAAGVEQHCDHPLARAVLVAAKARGLRPPSVAGTVAQAGLGVCGAVDGPDGPREVRVGGPALYAGMDLSLESRHHLEAMRRRGATALAVLEGGRLAGLLAITDTVRPEAANVLAALRRMGVGRMGMLSGDDAPAVERTARALGIEEARHRLLPEDKQRLVLRWRQEGHRVLYVGDGINDAPALAAADVAVAMGGAGSDVALDTAGMALVRDDISRLPFLVGLSRRMLATLRLNVGLGLASNAIAVAGGMAGLLSPVAASLMHNGGSLLVVLASAGLLLYRER